MSPYAWQHTKSTAQIGVTLASSAQKLVDTVARQRTQMSRHSCTPEIQLEGGIIKVCKARGVSDGGLDLEGGPFRHSPLKQHLWLSLQYQTQKMQQKTDGRQKDKQLTSLGGWQHAGVPSSDCAA